MLLPKSLSQRVAALALLASTGAYADTTPQTLPFAQDWTNTGLITANDDWSGVPGITGFLGDDGSTTGSPYAGGDPRTLTAATLGTAQDVIANQATPNTNTSGGVAEFEIANPTVAFQGSGTADSPYLQVYLNTSGKQNITVSYNLRDIDGSADNAVQPVALLYRVGSTGTFTNVPAAYVADASTGGSATQVTNVSATLPADANNQVDVELRIITINAVGSDEWTGVDDISIDGIPNGALTLSVGDATVTEGNSATVTAQFSVTLSGPAPAGGVTFNVATADNTATDADNDYEPTSVVGAFIPEGFSSVQFNVLVNGDVAVEPTETFFVDLSNISGTNTFPGDTHGIGTIQTDDFVQQTISQIQGNGRFSPFDGLLVGTSGNVVTALLPNGFFIQQPISDGVIETSDAMFVFTGTAPTVAIGDMVTIGGLVTEAAMPVGAGEANYSSLTKFSNAGLMVSVTATGSPLPPPFVLDAFIPSPNPAALLCAGGSFSPTDFASTRNFECLEAMRVSTTTGVISAPNQRFSTDPIAEMNITTSGQRALREPGVSIDVANENVALTNLTPPAPPLAAAPIWDANPEVFEIDLDRMGLPNTQVVPGSVFSATGVLGQEFGGYELFPQTFNVTAAAPALPVAVPTAGAGQLTVGSFNMHRYFDDVNDPGSYDDCATQGSADYCPTTQQYLDKQGKLANYVLNVLGAPTVLGAEEVENPNALQGLATRIGTMSGGTVSYTALMGADQNNDIGHINVGFLVRSDVIVDSSAQSHENDSWTFNGGTQTPLFDRPPFLLQAHIVVDGQDFAFAVQVNHTRSLLGIDDLTPLADQVDAHRIRQKRYNEAVAIGQDAQAFQTANPTVPLIVVGDFNAFEFTDGYADVIGVVRGTASLSPGTSQPSADTEYAPTANVTTPALSEAALSLPANQRYSFNFAGNSQLIDHALLTQAAQSKFGAIAFGRGNCDAPANLEPDANSPLRASDHDGFVVYLNVGDMLFKDGFE